MNSKRKMIVAVGALAMVVLAAVVAIVAVLATRNITIKSNVTVSYSVDDVFGFAKASYKYEGDASYTEWLEETEFDDTTSAGPTLSDQSFALTKNKKYVIIKFEFKKTSTSVENFKATLGYTSTANKNVTVTTGTTENDITTDATATMFDTNITSDSYTAFFVKIALGDTTTDANFAGSFEWTLSNIAST